MFSDSAEFYDAIYGFKDYAAEAAQLAELLRALHPEARTLLDVGCGTGEHARRLAIDHGYEVDGIDLDPNLIAIARRKHPRGRFEVDDMTGFSLGRRYDAVLCLFSAIGYVVTLDRIRRALDGFRSHLAPGGLVVVEPWLAPDQVFHGKEFRQTAELEGTRIERVSRTEVIGRVSRLHFDYRVDGPSGSRTFGEVHELGLFTAGEMRDAFRSCGFTTKHDPAGLTGRGLWVARAAGAISGTSLRPGR